MNGNGKVSVLWKAPHGSETLSLPCGKCIGCRLAYSKNWAIRCMHESEMHVDNSFVTLTYNDDHLPKDGNLNLGHFQLFMKRLRKKFGKVRFFHAGEYGGKFGRPHYHTLLFGLDFKDKVLERVTEAGSRLYVSPSLGEVWPFGFHSIGDLTYASAAYVARYCVKKVGDKFDYFKDDSSRKRFQIDKVSGEVKIAEYTTMSRRHGIGESWYRKYRSDVFPSDEVVFNGRRNKPPRYYDYLLDKEDPDLLESLKVIRSSSVNKFDNDSFRLRVKEQCKLASVKSLKRDLEVV